MTNEQASEQPQEFTPTVRPINIPLDFVSNVLTEVGLDPRVSQVVSITEQLNVAVNYYLANEQGQIEEVPTEETPVEEDADDQSDE